MAFIKSRKHAAPAARTVGAAVLLTLAHGAIATDAPADVVAPPQQAKVNDAQALPGMQVEADRSSDYRVEKVSSPKFTQSLLDTTQSIQVINKELIQQQGATTLTEALRNSPGVGTFYVGENGQTNTGDAIYMRGFDTSGSIFVDGARDLGTVSRDMFNIEQVEVTKGPDGTEYGRTAPTGAINLVTKQPVLGNGVSGTVQVGSGQRRRATADLNRQMGDTGAFRLNVLGQESGVYGRDQIENNRWGIAPSLAFGLGTPTRVYLDYLHVKQNNVPDGGIPTIGLPGYSSPDRRAFLNDAPKVDQDNYYGTTQDKDHVTQDLFTVIVEHDFNDKVALHNTSRIGRTTQDYLLTSFMGSTANLLTPNPADPSTWTIARSSPTFKHQSNRIATNQTNLTATIESGAVTQDISAGIELTQEKARTIGIAPLAGSTWPAANLYKPYSHVGGLRYGETGARSDGKTNTAAAYFFDTLKFGDSWQVNGGVRLDHYKTDFSSLVVCGARNGPVCGPLRPGSIVPGVDAKKSDNLFNYKVGVLYKPAANGSIYVNFAQSQEPPGGNTLTLSSSANSADNPSFDAQKARTAEVGTKWDLMDSKLLVTAALYRTTVTNELVQDPTDLLYYQIGKKRVQGVELTAIGKITENWAISAGFSTQDATVEKGAGVTANGSDDLAYTPKRSFTAWTTYHLPFNLTVGGGARYQGGLQRGTDGAVGTPAYTQSYWVFDAVASYPINRHVDIQLNVYNLFDKEYVAAINKSGYRYTPATPRSAMLQANIRF
ncbi:catecholate siderophore receptor [Luteibacter sp. UNC138MFCol5.1]|uniref:catecholate siderophore receptor Fiu n=1 Tax=Luteibacter sp. UNC138MFCol5.1 TaxID=1502774 RepID=UPI0008AAC0AB|nr:catecholate siderophore receptor Fiu [Luteibacter sp. UNC138MFCol5.1]SEP13515.1 catecholate siderophore receptor [Luteibacter sp. UNC138MFCol5.1]